MVGNSFLGWDDELGMRQVSDGELLGSTAAGFAEVYERHVGRVARYMARRVGNAAAEDLCAEVFVRALRGRDGYVAERATALPWLLGIANHVICDHRRAERRRLAMIERLAQITPELIGAHEPASLAPELAGELRRLPDALRDTFLLVVWGELSYEEAAGALSVPVGTVRSRVARARERLAQAAGAPVGQRGGVVLNGDAHA